jgi:hypothetical protein
MIEHAPSKEPPRATPRPDSEDELLEEGLRETFPASDPPASVRPHHPPNHLPIWDQPRETD